MAVLSAFFAAGQMLVCCSGLITCEVQAAAGGTGLRAHIASVPGSSPSAAGAHTDSRQWSPLPAL